MGISAVQTSLARREQFHQSRLDANIFPSSINYTHTLKLASAYFAQHGSSAAAARRQATAWIGQTLMNQAAFLAYIDVFAVLALFALLLVPASFLLQAGRPEIFPANGLAVALGGVQTAMLK